MNMVESELCSLQGMLTINLVASYCRYTFLPSFCIALYFLRQRYELFVFFKCLKQLSLYSSFPLQCVCHLSFVYRADIAEELTVSACNGMVSASYKKCRLSVMSSAPQARALHKLPAMSIFQMRPVWWSCKKHKVSLTAFDLFTTLSVHNRLSDTFCTTLSTL